MLSATPGMCTLFCQSSSWPIVLPQEVAGTRLLEHDPRYTNVSVLSDSTANFRVPEMLDVIWTAQNYHDLHDTFMGPADVAALNKRFFDALKPGGVYLVIDHVAEAGSGLRDTEALHRIDPKPLAAGN